MATVNRGTPGSGLWKGLAIYGTNSILVELQLKFARGRVTGTYRLRESRRSPQSGELTGTYSGSRIWFHQSPGSGTFRGRAESIAENTWMILGRLEVKSPKKNVGSLTVFHKAGDEPFISGVWDGASFA